jgi:putative chitinase
MNAAELKACMPYANIANCAKFAPWLTEAMIEFDIDTPLRQAYFLGPDIAHESGSLQYTSEIASGAAYEGRRDLGNDEPGDGIRYKGHGLIQTTGKANHFRVADYFGLAREGIVEWLQTPEGASRSAGLFWRDNNLSESADRDDIRTHTRILNGGYNGLNDRIQRLAEAKKGLGI